MPNYAKLCQTMPNYAKLCQTVPNCAKLCQGGLGVAGRAYVGGMTVVTDTTPATGGVGVSGGEINGAIVTAGGIGAAQSIYTGGQVLLRLL